MAEQKQDQAGYSMPIIGMCLLGIISMVIVGLCFIVIRSWPLPASVAPYFGGKVGLVWGLVVGGFSGLILGYLVDDKHFPEIKY
jgi:hypothetical protein